MKCNVCESDVKEGAFRVKGTYEDLYLYCYSCALKMKITKVWKYLSEAFESVNKIDIS